MLTFEKLIPSLKGSDFLDVLKSALDTGFDVNSVDEQGNSLAHYCVQRVLGPAVALLKKKMPT